MADLSHYEQRRLEALKLAVAVSKAKIENRWSYLNADTVKTDILDLASEFDGFLAGEKPKTGPEL